jgi:hypothetical protein
MRLREIPNKVRFQVSAEAVNSNSSGSIRECVDHCDAKGGSGAGRDAAKDEGTGLLAVHSSYYPEEGEAKSRNVEPGNAIEFRLPSIRQRPWTNLHHNKASRANMTLRFAPVLHSATT